MFSVALLALSVRSYRMTLYIKSFLIASLTSAALAAAACSQANSADQAPATTIEPAALATSWNIQAEGSHIRFSAKQEGETFTGAFNDFTGTINFDPETPGTGSVTISIPLKSVDAGSNDRNSTLPDKVWFSTKKFPTATFTSSDISAVDAGYLAKGQLTLKGQSVPIELPFALAIDGNTAIMTGTTKMDRTKWGVGAAPWDTDEWVSRNVDLDIQVTATKTE